MIIDGRIALTKRTGIIIGEQKLADCAISHAMHCPAFRFCGIFWD